MAGRVAAGLLPAALTVGLGLLVAENRLSFGAGDKDLMLVVPMGAWSLLYAVAYYGGLRSGSRVQQAVRGGAAWATLGVLWGGLLLLLQSRSPTIRLP